MKKNYLMAGALRTFILFTTLQWSATLHAQTITYQQELLTERIQKIINQTGNNIAFNPRMISEVKAAPTSGEPNGAEILLQRSLAGTGFTFRKLGENDFMIIPNSLAKGTGHISGIIVDQVGNPVVGARVSVAGKTVRTDNNGVFILDVPAGLYTLTVSAGGYSDLRVQDLNVKNNETANVSFALNSASTKESSIKEVVITATRKADTQAGLLAQQKKAAQMSDGISAEQISKTPDNDVGATLKRVTGVTTIDNKYVVVRSMGERWNTAAMDGINMPSTEAYNQNFSFDIIPTAMVESVVVSKTATPDMNASFAGGYVEVKTKDIPNQDFLTVSMGTSYNTVSTFKDFLTKQRGKNDYWGFDSNGLRDYPKDLSLSNWDTPNFLSQSKLFTQDNFTTYGSKADLGSNYQLALGRSYKIGKNDNKFGFAGAVSMRHEESILDIDHTSRSGWLHNIFRAGDEPAESFNFKNQGAQYRFLSRMTGMLNFGLQLGKNRISFRNSYTHVFDNSLTRTTGWHEYSGSGHPGSAEGGYAYYYNHVLLGNNTPLSVELPFTEETNYPVYQTLWGNKAEGNHRLGNVEVNWFGARNSIDSENKDYTRLQKIYRTAGDEIFGLYQIYNSLNRQQHGNIENSTVAYNVGANIAFETNFSNVRTKIKLGYFGSFSENTNIQQRAFLRVNENRPGVSPSTRNYYYFDTFNNLFHSRDWENGTVGWAVNNYYGGRYRGKMEIHTPFLMLDHRFGSKWRFVWGARAENFKYTLLETQREIAVEDGFSEEQEDEKKWEILPSGNLTFSPNSKSNIRLAYSRIAIRPQFQERTSIPYYDPVISGLILNAAGVYSSIGDNYDLKYEWFPGLGEIFSFGVYHKVINNPIERTGYNTPEGNLELNVANSKKAVLTGIEAEARKSLGFISGGFLDHIFISGNVTLNKTKVTAYIDRFGNNNGEYSETYEADRPMYGQTPWAYNMGLGYEGDRMGLNIAYNAKGDQYVQVGYNYKDEEIQRPYHLVDAQLSYKMLREKNLQFKLNIRNVLDTAQEFYNNFYSYKTLSGNTTNISSVRDYYKLSPGATDKYDKGIDEITFRSKNGRQISFSVEYTF